MESTHKFPTQGEPRLDIVWVELENKFGIHTQEIHNSIVEVMEQEGVSINDDKTRLRLAKMCIRFTGLLCSYDFQSKLPVP